MAPPQAWLASSFSGGRCAGRGARALDLTPSSSVLIDLLVIGYDTSIPSIGGRRFGRRQIVRARARGTPTGSPFYLLALTLWWAPFAVEAGRAVAGRVASVRRHLAWQAAPSRPRRGRARQIPGEPNGGPSLVPGLLVVGTSNFGRHPPVFLLLSISEAEARAGACRARRRAGAAAADALYYADLRMGAGPPRRARDGSGPMARRSACFLLRRRRRRRVLLRTCPLGAGGAGERASALGSRGPEIPVRTGAQDRLLREADPTSSDDGADPSPVGSRRGAGPEKRGRSRRHHQPRGPGKRGPTSRLPPATALTRLVASGYSSSRA